MGFDESLAEDAREAEEARRLSLEAGVPLVDLATQSIDPVAFALIPEDFAKRHWLVAYGVDMAARTIQVAVRDPYNVEPLREIRLVTGLEPDIAVATLSHIRGAIEWGPPRSRVSRRSSPGAELSVEDTRRVSIDAPPESELGPSRTSPSHRIEDDATVEQRLEALVLALIESGAISRAQYVDALRRLLHRR